MAILARLFEIMRLRAGPQDMPGGQTPVAVAAGCYALTGVVQLTIHQSAQQAISLALLTTLLLAIYTAALLLWRKVPNRFRQTATALFATGAVFSVIMLAPSLALAPYLEAVQIGAGGQPPVATETGNANGNAVSGQPADSAPAQSSPTTGQTSRQTSNQASDDNAMASEFGGQPRVPTSAFWALLLFAVIGIWRLIVFSHIYREALDTKFWKGLIASLGYELFLLSVFALF